MSYKLKQIGPSVTSNGKSYASYELWHDNTFYCSFQGPLSLSSAATVAKAIKNDTLEPVMSALELMISYEQEKLDLSQAIEEGLE